eukprot:c28373_g1_i1 orf=804-2429(-)
MQHLGGVNMGNKAKERDEDLALFHDMQKREGDKRKMNPSPGHAPNGSIVAKTTNPSSYRIPSLSKIKRGDDLLTLDLDKNDYDWLLTPPATPSLPALDQGAPRARSPSKGKPLIRSLAGLKTSRLSNANELPLKLLSDNVALSQQNPSSKISPSGNAFSKRSAGTKTTTGPLTQTGRAIMPCTTSTRPTSLPRASTPTWRSSVSGFRQNQASGTTARSSSVSKASSLASRSATSSRGSSPTIRRHPWQSSAIPGFSLETPPNLRTTLPERSMSNAKASAASTGPGVTTAKTTRSERSNATNKSRRQLCSPLVTRGQLALDSQGSGITNSKAGKLANGWVETSAPNVMGSSMVENATPLISAALVLENQSVMALGKATVQDSSGFGKNVSKKPLDMALRNMVIHQNTSNGYLRGMQNVPASTLHSVRTSNGQVQHTNSAAYSPMATSSIASSEYSTGIVHVPGDHEQVDEEMDIEKGNNASSMCQLDLAFSNSKESNVTAWVASPDYRDDSVELMQLFREGIERFSGPESPLFCQHDQFSDL